MSDHMHAHDASFDNSPSFVDERGGNTALVCYGLMIATLFTAFATGLIALIVAYIAREDDNHWTNSHYIFLIRTFWISILYAIIVGFFSFVIGWIPLIGWAVVSLMALFTTAWFVGRNVIGLMRALAGRPIDNPRSWLFG